MKKVLTNILILVLFSQLLFSCGLLHKTTNKRNEHRIEREKKNLDSTGSKKSDSFGVKTSDSASLKKTEVVKTSGVEIEFQDTSSHNKVEITTDSSGKQVIKAEGKIKRIKTSKKQEQKTIDSSNLQKKDTASRSEEQKTKVSSSSNVKKSSDAKVVQKEKKSFRVPWYGYVVGIVFLLLLLVYMYKRYRHQIIAWFIRLKNPGTNVYYDPKMKGYQVINKKKRNSS